jgi:chemotaxis-related protein WspD
VNDSGLQHNDSTVADLQLAAAGNPPTQVFDCWTTIGVEGNRTCRELQTFIHCRNCPVYSAAARQLLDRPLSADYRREWTEHFALEKKLAAPLKTSALIFRIGPEWLALPTQIFQEVAERRRIHTLPHRRQGIVLGLVNIRGELLICASLGRLLGLEPETPRGQSRTVYDRLLVVASEGNRLTFPVEEVHGIHRFHRDDLKEPPATVAQSAQTYTQGIFPWREHTVGFLNPGLLFNTLDQGLT